MSEKSETPSKLGTFGWFDLTVPDAAGLKDFYGAVVGWKVSEVPMGDYADYTLEAPAKGPVAGLCHARGANASLPPMWILYVYVADLEASLGECRSRGGALVSGPHSYGAKGKYAVIRDPAGACIALYQEL